MKRIKLLVLLTVCVALLGFTTAFASQEYDGYVVKIASDAELYDISLFSEDISVNTPEKTAEFLVESVDEIEAVCTNKGIIKVSDEAVLERLMQTGLVEVCEKNYYAELYGYVPEVNPNYKDQWGMAFINAAYAWDAGIYGNNVRVAVIDSGIYPNVDLAGNIAKGHNYLDGSDDTTDVYGHGTAVAGIIAAQCNNIGTVGIAHRATLVPLKVTDEKSGIRYDDIISAINDAVDVYDCDVINMSFGMSEGGKLLEEAINYAASKKCILVAAAGNYSSNSGVDTEKPYRYPASYANVVSVANAEEITVDGVDTCRIADSSQKNDKINIAAPGTKIYSAKNSETGVVSGSGTSFSAPIVSAAAALVKTADRSVTQADFNYYLTSTADSSYITQEQGSDCWGAGMLDIGKLIESVLDGKKVLLSPVDVEPYGDNTSVYIHNPTAETQEYEVTITALYPAQKTINITLEPFKTYEISMTQLKIRGDTTLTVYSANDEKVLAGLSYTFEQLEEEFRKFGDVNADGKVNALDLLILMKYFANLGIELSDEDMYFADVCFDEKLNELDCLRLAKYLAGWDVVLG